MRKNIREMINQESVIKIFSSDLGKFAAKTGIVIFGLFILISLSLPSFSDVKDGLKQFEHGLKRLETPKSKLFLLGLVQNPVALWKYSEIEEINGKTDNAIRAMEFAIGLLEMHGTDKQNLKRYADRIEKLKTKK